MNGWEIGADIGAMITGLSALTAVATWFIGRSREWRQDRAQRRLRNYHAYLAPDRHSEWWVRVVDDPQTPTATVVLEVLDSDGGQPSPQLAYSLRTIVDKDRTLCQAPTPEEFAFLLAQRAARKDTGFPVGSEGNTLSFPLMGWWRR